MSAFALLLVAAASAQAPPRPTFTVGVEAVYVDVFVTDGNRPVVGLTAADFELRDNGVRQPGTLLIRDRKGAELLRSGYAFDGCRPS